MKFKDLKSEGMQERYTEYFKCFCCGDDEITQYSKFCPNCGEKIDKDEA